mmetsp:Transcript_8410/g.27055  ORF Transcript_8410/g.27055 Transcript_8410/m.27055 type:complete len:465 (+) Transcript_8410:274-1668(+)
MLGNPPLAHFHRCTLCCPMQRGAWYVAPSASRSVRSITLNKHVPSDLFTRVAHRTHQIEHKRAEAGPRIGGLRASVDCCRGHAHELRRLGRFRRCPATFVLLALVSCLRLLFAAVPRRRCSHRQLSGARLDRRRRQRCGLEQLARHSIGSRRGVVAKLRPRPVEGSPAESQRLARCCVYKWVLRVIAPHGGCHRSGVHHVGHREADGFAEQRVSPARLGRAPSAQCVLQERVEFPKQPARRRPSVRSRHLNLPHRSVPIVHTRPTRNPFQGAPQRRVEVKPECGIARGKIPLTSPPKRVHPVGRVRCRLCCCSGRGRRSRSLLGLLHLLLGAFHWLPPVGYLSRRRFLLRFRFWCVHILRLWEPLRLADAPRPGIGRGLDHRREHELANESHLLPLRQSRLQLAHGLGVGLMRDASARELHDNRSEVGGRLCVQLHGVHVRPRQVRLEDDAEARCGFREHMHLG